MLDARDASTVLQEYANVSSGCESSFSEAQKKLANYNKDGYVDDYLDENGNKMVYEEAKKDDYKNGVAAPHLKVNLNPIKPPKYIKVFNNNGHDTDGDGVGDTGGIILSLDRTDNLGVEGGGFFGETKFYYAPDKYYTGTPAENAAEDTVFRFN